MEGVILYVDVVSYDVEKEKRQSLTTRKTPSFKVLYLKQNKPIADEQ